MGKTTIGSLNVTIGGNSLQLVSALGQARSSVSSFASSLSGLAAPLAGLLSAGAMVQIGQDSVRTALELEKVGVAFETVAKNSDLAKKSLEQVRQFADVSPFSTEETLASARKLLGTGTQLKALVPNLRVLGEVAAGSGGDIGLMAKALSDVTSKGHLAAQETNQFSDQGVNLISALAEMYGIGRDEVLKMREAHLITARDVRQALLNMTTGVGIYAGGMDRLAKSQGGQLEQMKAQWARAKEALGLALMPAILNVSAAITVLVKALSGMSKETTQSRIKFLAWVVATGAFIAAGAAIIRTVQMVIGAYRAMSAAIVMSQALSGPRGWATVAAGMAAATLAAGLVSKAFADVSAEVQGFAEMTKAEKDLFLGPVKNATASIKDEADEATKALDSLRERGKSLTESLRTPTEEVAARVAELKTLFNAAAISADTYQRGMEKARDDLREQLDLAKEIRGVQQGVGAVIRGTVQGFSAIQESQRTLQAMNEQKEIERQQLAELQKADELLRQIERNTAVPPIDAKIVAAP